MPYMNYGDRDRGGAHKAKSSCLRFRSELLLIRIVYANSLKLNRPSAGFFLHTKTKGIIW
jgi:hypothetical protein